MNEAWVAGLNSTDGLDFGGDPILVMPRLPLRAAINGQATTVAATYPAASALRVQPPPALHSSGAGGDAADAMQLMPLEGAHDLVAHRRTQEVTVPPHQAAATEAIGGATETIGGSEPRPREGRYSGAEPPPLSTPLSTPPHQRSMFRNRSMTQRQHNRRRSGRAARLASIQEAAASMSHNLALAVSSDGTIWYAAGGRHNRVNDVLAQLSPLLKAEDVRRGLGFDPTYFGAPRTGVHLVRGLTWRYAAEPATSTGAGAAAAERRRQGGGEGAPRHPATAPAHHRQTKPSWLHSSGAVDEPATTQWQQKRHILSGRHPGCVERRDATSRFFNYLHPGGVCEFDGRLSLVRFGATLLLYARANPAAHGSRHVQVTRSADNGATWSPFEQIQLQNYAGDGDIYFFGAQVNPSHNGSLVAVFPVTHRLRGCIGLAASLDGVHWSRVTPLLSCDLYGERTLDQPALPAMVRRGEEVWLYVHEEVPGITIDRSTPLLLHTSLVRAERNSRVARYAFPCRHLARWTLGALKTLQPALLRLDHSCAADGGGTSSARAVAASCLWSPRGPATTERQR